MTSFSLPANRPDSSPGSQDEQGILIDRRAVMGILGNWTSPGGRPPRSPTWYRTLAGMPINPCCLVTCQHLFHPAPCSLDGCLIRLNWLQSSLCCCMRNGAYGPLWQLSCIPWLFSAWGGRKWTGPLISFLSFLFSPSTPLAQWPVVSAPPSRYHFHDTR